MGARKPGPLIHPGWLGSGCLFDLVHGRVCGGDYCVRLNSIAGQTSSSDAEAQLVLAFSERDGSLSNGVHKSVSHDGCRRDVGLRKNESELIATQAGAEVGGAAAGSHHAGDGFEGFIAGMMAISVVDLLKKVDVDQEQGEWAVTKSSGNFELQDFFKFSAVEQARERIRGSQIEQFRIGLLQAFLIRTEHLSTLANQQLKSTV